MKARKGGMKEVSDLVGKLRLPAAVKEHLRSHLIWSKWDEIVGPELFRVTAPLEIRGHTLLVQVAHQAWAQQLHFLRPSILGKIRTYSPSSKLKDLQFRVGPIEHQEFKKPKEPNSKTDVSSKSSLGAIKLSERQEMTLRAVEDSELRESIRRAMEAEVGRTLS